MKNVTIILVIGILGTLALSFWLPKEPLKQDIGEQDIGAGELTQLIGEKNIVYSFTDDNTNETFIIKSDKENYSGLGKFHIQFSVTNNSGKNQNIKIGIPLIENNKRKIESLKRFVRNDDVIIPESTTIIPATATTTQQEIIVPAKTVKTPVWVTLNTDKTTYSVSSKKTTRLNTIKDYYSDSILVNETLYYELILDYGTEKATNEEFFIEVFGEKGDYGNLDPTITTIDGFNSDTKSTGNLNGQDGWTGSTSFQVQNSVVQEGDQAVGCNACDSLTILLDTSAKTSGIFGVYLRADNAGDGSIIDFYQSTTRVGRFKLYPGVNGATLHGSGTTVLASPPEDVYKLFEMEINPVTDQIRGRYEGGSWSSWVAAENAFDQVDRVRLFADSITGGTYAYWDYLYYSDNITTLIPKKKVPLIIFD